MFGWFTSKKKTYDQTCINDYFNQTFKHPSKTVIRDVTFVVLDCETSGLQSTDEIITIGAIKCTPKELFINEVLDQKYPEIDVGKSAEIHGELSSKSEATISDLVQELIQYVNNHIIVGHNIAFDIHMINNLLQDTYQFKLKNRVLDTAQLMMRLDPVFFERSIGGKSMLHLDDLCDNFSIEIQNRHTAVGDAYLTGQLFQRLISRLRGRGIDSLGQLLK